jgi:hypothetical protein
MDHIETQIFYRCNPTVALTRILCLTTGTCLPSRCPETASVYLPISRSLHSSGSTRYTTLMRWKGTPVRLWANLPLHLSKDWLCTRQQFNLWPFQSSKWTICPSDWGNSVPELVWTSLPIYEASHASSSQKLVFFRVTRTTPTSDT